MKKNLFFYLFAVLCTVGFFCSCSNDDEGDNGIQEISGPMVGTWALEDIVKNEEGTFVSGPVQMTWEAEEGTTLGGLPVVMLPSMANGFGSIALAQVLKEVTLDPEGNITAVYAEKVDMENPVENPEWKTAEGYATYKKVNDNQILVFLNLEKIMGAVSRENNNPINAVLDLVKNGIPVNIIYNGGKAYFYIDKTFVEEKVAPLLPVLANLIPDDAMGDMGAIIKPLLIDFPNALQKTTKLEIGINFKK